MEGAIRTIVTLALGLAGCASAASPAPHRPHDDLGDASTAEPAYRWLTIGRLYWVTGPVEPDLLVAVLGSGRAPVRLSGDIAALKGFLAMQFNGRLPSVSALSAVAHLVKDAVFGKRGRIATDDFYDSQE